MQCGFSSRIQGGSGFIQNNEFWITQHHTRNR
ncbi:Uncharacterised protein [Vibrio cholerae]|nr:Uncharacterised protein [Vibrio cholerae]